MSGASERGTVVAGAVAGFAGVALSAAAAHLTGPGNLETAARFLLAHAPVLIGTALAVRTGLAHRWAGRCAALALGLGLALFCGDLALRALAGRPLAAVAAPAGGILLMAGWGVLGLSVLLPSRAADR